MATRTFEQELDGGSTVPTQQTYYPILLTFEGLMREVGQYTKSELERSTFTYDQVKRLMFLTYEYFEDISKTENKLGEGGV